MSYSGFGDSNRQDGFIAEWIRQAVAAHNADPTAHGGMLMPAFISETHTQIDGGATDDIAIPAGAHWTTVEIILNGAAVGTDVEISLGSIAPPDNATTWQGGAVMPYGALVAIPAHCIGGVGVPDTVHLNNKHAPGSTIDFTVRFYG